MPSLFTFNIKDARINELAGLAVERIGVKIQGTKLQEIGPMLITHWGMSGPAILKLSSIAARHLFDQQYRFSISIDFALNENDDDVKESFFEQRTHHPKKAIVNTPLFDIPKRLWQRLTEYAGIKPTTIWAELPQKEHNKLLETIKRAQFQVDGKSTNKEEFVTCGGVALHQVNFTDFSSKKHSNLYFVGEVLNIDALTGGFNFQAAWTGGYMVSQSI
jgi:predicted Rossmann fold flavoprotein